MQVVSSFKISTKIITSTILSASLIILAPLNSLAVSNIGPATNNQKPSTIPATSQFCNSFNVKANAVTARVSNLSGKLSQAWTRQDQKIASQQQQVNQKIAADRQQADATRAADFTKLEAKATTSVQKQAVQTYENAVNGAVTVRRASFDSARKDFRAGLQNIIDTNRNTVSSQLDSFSGAVNTAITNAEASCSGTSTTAATIRTTFQSAMKSAQGTYRNDRSGDVKIGTQVQALVATRDAAFNAAEQAFQTTIASARQTLIQAFANNSTTVK
jgi:hypothetical protein